MSVVSRSYCSATYRQRKPRMHVCHTPSGEGGGLSLSLCERLTGSTSQNCGKLPSQSKSPPMRWSLSLDADPMFL